MRRALAIVLTAAVWVGGSAAAAQTTQEWPAMLATGLDQFGQGVGEVALDRKSVFVVASGTVRLPSVSVQGPTVEIAATGPNAAAAAQALKRKTDAVAALAKRYNVGFETRDPTYDFGGGVSGARPTPLVIETVAPGSRPAATGAPTPPEPRVTATVQARIGRPSASATPEFLDALKAAGVDNPAGRPGFERFPRPTFGFGSPEATAQVEPATWDAAARDAVASARSQAEVLAEAAGVRVGEVRSIAVIHRTADERQATVHVAIRFGLQSAD